MADAISEGLVTLGLEVMKVAEESGDKPTRDHAKLAKSAGDALASAFTGCVDSYTELLATYKGADDVRKLDFTLSENLLKADDAVAKLKDLTPAVEACAKDVEKLSTESFPLYQAFSETMTAAAHQENVDYYAKGMKGFYPISHALDRTDTPKMSTCSGKQVVKAAPLTLAECAQACDVTRYPEDCIGFQFVKVPSAKTPLCILFSQVFSTNTYEC